MAPAPYRVSLRHTPTHMGRGHCSSGVTLRRAHLSNSDKHSHTKGKPLNKHDAEMFMMCRTLGHAWFDADSDWTPAWGTPLTLRCERCRMERRDAIDTTGGLATRRYVIPEGYGYTRDDPAPNRDGFRLMFLQAREARLKRLAAQARKAAS